METSSVIYGVEGALTQPEQVVNGGEYIYTRGNPVKCHGYRYRVIRREVMDVPSYQKKVLVQAVDGPDKGMIFTCSLSNFCTRYVPAPRQFVEEKTTPEVKESVG